MKKLTALSCVISSLLLYAGSAFAIVGNPYTYTVDSDFDAGTLINVDHAIADQLQLLDVGEAFDFIWVAASARGTIIKIDTNTGDILGEYKSAPDGRARNPSRTTVDANGNVWAGNRAEVTPTGSVIHIGLLENGQCVDRNANGLIDTSTGLGDIRPWLNPGGVDNGGGVSTADDECIIHYVRTAGTAVRTVAVDGANNVWVGGWNNRIHELYDSSGSLVGGSTFNLGCGGYGGLVDGNGILWSATMFPNELLRFDPATSTGDCLPIWRYSYGLGIDSEGDIWHTNYSYDTVMEIAPDGTIIGLPHSTFGASADRGVAVTYSDNNVWVANSGGSDVSRLDSDGNLVAIISVGANPTGVAVDANGKVWATNLSSSTVSRIDPATNLVDLTVDLGLGAGPYNYSDMTGSTLNAPPDIGTWSVVHDSGLVGAPWNRVSWNALEPGDSSIVVTVASSADGVTFGPAVVVVNAAKPAVADNQYLSVSVAFTRSTTDGDLDGVNDSPILQDLTVVANLPPDCSGAYPSVASIWPPNHKFVDVEILGVTDPDGDFLTITIDSIFQDEPVDDVGDGAFVADGIIGDSIAEVRAERSGDYTVPGLGNGRVYHIGFTATDDLGGACSGEVLVDVPLDKSTTVVDEGALYDSTLP